MLDGLANMFQCDEREAIRIALYEASRSASEAHELAFRYADTKATDKAHQGRSSAKQWNLPKSEKDKASEAAKEIGITDAEFIRLAIIWLRNGIRSDSIKQLTKSKRIEIDDVAIQWSRDNQGKPPNEQVANFKKALMEAQALFDYMDEIKFDERLKKKKESSSMPWAMRAEIDQVIFNYEAAQDQWFEDLLDGGFIEDVKFQMELSIVRNYNVDWDTASLIVADDLLGKADPKRMKPLEKLELIKKGRMIAADQTKIELEKLEAKRANELAEASTEWGRKYAESGSIDSEQRKRDIEAAEQIRKEEMEQDQQDYLNDPKLWDNDSHKRLQ